MTTEVVRRYLREFALSMAAYVVAIVITVGFVGNMEPSLLRYLFALLPIAPVAAMLWSFLRYLEGVDELEQRIHLQGIGFAAGATGLLTFSYGLLQNTGLPEISMVWVLPLLIVTWGVGAGLARRRYR